MQNNEGIPPKILDQITQLTVPYVDFTGEEQQGIIEINSARVDDVRQFFALAFKLRFPIERVVRAHDEPFNGDDLFLMRANATSGFNYRLIAGTDEMSQHSLGCAFDVNTRLNPYIRIENEKEIVEPAGATWDTTIPGTLTPTHPLVELMLGLGWTWGGTWDARMRAIDYQHFEKPL